MKTDHSFTLVFNQVESTTGEALIRDVLKMITDRGLKGKLMTSPEAGTFAVVVS